MMTRLDRRAVLAFAMALSTAGAAEAATDPAAEKYVGDNLTMVLNVLSDRSLSTEARATQFRTLMSRFGDIPRVANFVLGRYSAQLRSDAALNRDWQAAFVEYGVAVYQDQLDQFRGNQMRVTGSIVRTPGRDVIVRTEITPRGQTRPMPVQWRVLNTNNAWKAVDVSLVLEGSEIWLAQQQQRDFLAMLDRNKGNIRALIATINQQTQTMRARIAARR